MSKTSRILAVSLILLVGIWLTFNYQTPDAVPIIVESGAETLMVYQNQILRFRIDNGGAYHLFCIYQFQFSNTALGIRTTYWTPSGFFSEHDKFVTYVGDESIIGLTLYELTSINYQDGYAMFTKIRDIFGGNNVYIQI